MQSLHRACMKENKCYTSFFWKFSFRIFKFTLVQNENFLLFLSRVPTFVFDGSKIEKRLCAGLKINKIMLIHVLRKSGKVGKIQFQLFNL